MEDNRYVTTSLSYCNTCLRLSDIDILTSNDWISDSILSFYLEYIKNEVLESIGERFLFVSPEVTQCIKLISTEEVGIFLEPLNAHDRSFIFFAVNDQQLLSAAGGSHWNLLVFSKPENTFYNFDSLYGNSTASDQLVNVMKKYLKCSDAKFVHADTLQQNNGFDCGIHVLCNVDQVAKHICKSGKIYGVKKISYNQVSSKREELLQIIRELGGRMN